MAWRCKECGNEVEVRADIVGDYQIYLDKDGKIDDYVIRRTLYLNQGVVTLVECKTCGEASKDVKLIAEWSQEEGD